MESVLAAFIIIFVILFGVLTLSGAFLSNQDAIRVTWLEMEERLADQSRTSLTAVQTSIEDSGTTVKVTLRNDGLTKLADFQQWDMILHYFDDGEPSVYHINWMPYADNMPAANEWTVNGFYIDAGDDVNEAYEPEVLNPGEEIVVKLKLSPAIGPGTTIQATLVTPNGVSASAMETRNVPPELTINAGLTLPGGTSLTIGNTLLAATDPDGVTEDIVFAVTTPPAEGALSLGPSFTQQDIDAGSLSYTHTGDGADAFAFTIADDEDVVGEYTFVVTVDMPPTLDANLGLAMVSGGIAVIDNTILSTSDSDTAAADLVYQITVPPTEGSLSLGDTFTQQDIDDGLLSYMHTGTGDDSFQFTITDGSTVIGQFTFIIDV